MSQIKLVQGDTAPTYQFSLVRADGTIPNLTGATVNFYIKGPTGTATNAGHTACTITDVAGGLGYYDFQTNDLPSAGTYTCDLSITFASGKIETAFKQVELSVRAQNG